MRIKKLRLPKNLIYFLLKINVYLIKIYSAKFPLLKKKKRKKKKRCYNKEKNQKHLL